MPPIWKCSRSHGHLEMGNNTKHEGMDMTLLAKRSSHLNTLRLNSSRHTGKAPIANKAIAAGDVNIDENLSSSLSYWSYNVSHVKNEFGKVESFPFVLLHVSNRQAWEAIHTPKARFQIKTSGPRNTRPNVTTWKTLTTHVSCMHNRDKC